jgi:hypothetical protein
VNLLGRPLAEFQSRPGNERETKYVQRSDVFSSLLSVLAMSVISVAEGLSKKIRDYVDIDK